MYKNTSYRVHTRIMLVIVFVYLFTRDLWVDKIPESVIQFFPYIALGLMLFVLGSIAKYFVYKQLKKSK